MKKITKKQFLADVMHEIEMLKLHATDEEKGRLDFDDLDASLKTKCIYGQMTGNCTSKRAKELMDASCIRVMHLQTGCSNIQKKLLSENLDKINGEYNAQTWTHGRRDWSYLSAVEGYILFYDAKNAQIIAYIKGEREALSL